MKLGPWKIAYAVLIWVLALAILCGAMYIFIIVPR
jgi:hypothetical protein